MSAASPRKRQLADAVQRQHYDIDGRARDDLGRILPSPFNWAKLIRAVPSLVAGPERAFRKTVPEEFYTADTLEDGTPVFVIACPCGAAPSVPISRALTCRCWRFYLALADRVLVANSPKPWARESS